MAEVDLSELERYLRIFQENPDSRVFAPLADLYRRLGKLNEAEEICRDGIRRHPYYAGGRVALSHILLDKGQMKEALQEIESVVTYYPDNLLARKILIRVLGALNEVDRARREFEALKHLAPMVASDPDVERALHGTQVPSSLPERPRVRAEAPRLFAVAPAAEPTISEAIVPKSGPSLARSPRLTALLREKRFLETFIRELGSASTLS